MKYEIQIGLFLDMDKHIERPEKTIIITEDQFEVIKLFADTRIDKKLEKIYKLNEAEFKIFPRFDL